MPSKHARRRLANDVASDDKGQYVTMASDKAARLRAWREQYAADVIGEHPTVLALLGTLRRIAEASCDTLVTGASGTGKELVARCIHRASRRSQRPFVAINCAAIPKELMESEIFGHARGAFTGATERRIGKFEMANGGTLFLDEIGEMEPMLQSKLLRVLQERELTPIGGMQTVQLDIRIIAATNQDLPTLCKERLFREDLYYRLNVVPLHLPALCERREDIIRLANHFIARANQRHGRALSGIDASAALALTSYEWPGNIRELHNIIERIAVLKPDDGSIGLGDLPENIAQGCLESLPEEAFVSDTLASSLLARPVLTPSPLMDVALPEGGVDINVMLAQMETRLTLDALTRSKGNKAKAAELLGLKRTTLVERLKKLNIHPQAGM